MKIFMLSDYFWPHNPGGSEWSVFELAKALAQKKVESTVVTLNYGAPRKETFEGIKITRLPFFKKLTDKRKVVNPVWQNNPIFFLSTALALLRVIKEEKQSLIHVHGKFLIPAAIIAGFISNVPVIVTIRDKQLLCSIGKCFFEKNRFRACNLWEYLTKDLPWFWESYVTDKNLFTLVYIFLGAVWTRLAYELIKFFAKRARVIIAISNSQKAYLVKNGFENVKVIYNTAQFRTPSSKVQAKKSVLFVGKLSKGKGGEVLARAIKILIKKNDIEFLFAGTPDLKSLYESILTKQELTKHVKFLGSLDHEELTKLYERVSLVVMPSIYPEAFGRVAMESLAQGTPAVVANTGALPEIVEDRITGRVVEPEAELLTEAILDVIKNEREYKDNIKRKYPKLKNKFHDIPMKAHLNLYRSLVK